MKRIKNVLNTNALDSECVLRQGDIVATEVRVVSCELTAKEG